MISGFRKIIIATLSLLCFVVNANASDFIVNGLGYLITSENTVALTNIFGGDEGSDAVSWPFDSENDLYIYEGDIKVPSDVNYGGKSYTVTSIDEYTFLYFDNLGIVEFPATITSVGDFAFEYCYASQIILPGTISNIGEEAFFDCQGIESIKLDVAQIPDYCFKRSSLLNVAFSEKLVSISKEAFRETNIENVVIPNSVTSISKSAFNSCLNLKSVTLPSNDAFTTIKDGSFQNCSSLEKLIIPKNVTTIEAEAFRDSKSLQYIKSDAYYAPSLSATAFKGADVNNVQLFVPTGAGENYSTAAVWKDFKSIYAGPIVAINMSTDPIATGKVMGEGFFGNDATITLTAEANPKYKFVGWEFEKPSGLITEESVEGNVNKLGFVLTTAIINAMNEAGKDLDVIAKFEKLTFGITLAAVEEEWGQIVNVETDEVVSGTTVVSEIDSKLYVAAQAADGYEFVKWVDGNGNEVSTKTNLIIDVQANKTYKAVFKEKTAYKVNLTVNGDEYGVVTGLRTEGRYLEGQRLALTAVANENCSFVGWTVDGVDVNSEEITYEIENVLKDYEIVATFAENPKSTITLAVENNVGGSVKFAIEDYASPLTMYVGKTATIIATADEHYKFDKWVIKGDDDSERENAENPCVHTFVEGVNYTYSAVFTEDAKYTITVESNMAEASDLEPSVETLYVGETKTLSFNVKEGYDFVEWRIKHADETVSKSSDAMQTVHVAAEDLTYTAIFTEHQYEITVASSVENGKILLSTNKAKEGETVTLTFEPATGYAVDNASITTNAGLVITDNSFVMPKRDVEVSAVFIEDICMVCNEVAEVGDLYDWILMVNNSDLEAKGYKFGENDVEWYQVNGEPDEWCDGEQNPIGEADKKVTTGYYFMDNKTSLIGTGDYYVVIRLVAGQKCKAITSKVISYTSNKSLYLTPSAVRQGQSLTLTGLPDADATVRIYDMNGKQVRMIKTDGAQSITFEAENAAGVYVVNVSAGPVSKSIKYVVK